MALLNGVHHVAFMTANVKKQIEFFSDVLGLKLKALYWMHNVDGYFHAFMELNPNSSVAFVFAPMVKDIPTKKGVSHAGNPIKPCSAGVMQHIAFSVSTESELLTMRDRIRSNGVRVLGPLNHGFCQSIYFAGPEDLALEISTSASSIDAEAWIDPEVVALNDISETELARYKSPDLYKRDKDVPPISQPPSNNNKPEYSEMDPAFAAAFDLPDEIVTKELSESTPPVTVI
jgi:catechol 2,3-dioxygenase-like lactoylglutathione lyase family enzyme